MVLARVSGCYGARVSGCYGAKVSGYYGAIVFRDAIILFIDVLLVAAFFHEIIVDLRQLFVIKQKVVMHYKQA